MADLSQTSPSDSPPMQSPKWLRHVDGRLLYPPVILLIILLLIFLYYYISRILSKKLLRLNETAAEPAPSAGASSPAASACCNARRPNAVPLPPVVAFSAEERRGCAVCLGEFGDGEKGRLLPRCCHGFHVECIDTWLRSHSTCPVCRSSVVTIEARAAASDEAV